MALAGVPTSDALAGLLPAGAVGVERGAIGADRADGPMPELYPVEEQLVAGASDGRRREFAEARACAREALERLGVSGGPIPATADGAPTWPEGVVGSITHKGGYRAAAVAFAADLAGLGIDAELDQALPAGVLATIASREELDQVRTLLSAQPEVTWDRLLFCAKEAAVKALYPFGLRVTGARGVRVSLDASGAVFTATDGGRRGIRIEGTWTVDRGLVLAAARAG